MRKNILLIFAVILLAGTLCAGGRVTVHFFYSKSCEHCAEVLEEYFRPLSQEYSSVLILRILEIEEDLSNYEKLIEMEEEFGDEGNEIPVVFVEDSVFGGDEIERLKPYLAALLESASSKSAGKSPADTSKTAAAAPADTPEEIAETAEEATTKADRVPVTLAFFWEPGCEHCQRVTYDLELLKERHPTLIVRDWNIDEREAKKLNEALSIRRDVPQKKHLTTPAIFLADTFFITDGISFRAIDEAVSRLEKSITGDTVWNIPEEELIAAGEAIRSRFKGLQVAPVIGAGLIDGVNPCAFGAIIFFVTFLTVVERKKKEILAVGVAFTLSVFLTYLLIGAGFLRFLQALPFLKTIAHYVYIATGVLAIALGIISLFDFFRSMKGDFGGMVLQLPDKLKKRIHKVIISENEPRARRNIVIAAISTGFLVSILELACTGQVYLPTIIYVMGAPGLKAKAYLFLLLYNLMFILPLVGVFALVYLGVTSDQLTKFLKRNTPIIKVLTALVFFAMAFFLWRTVLVG